MTQLPFSSVKYPAFSHALRYQFVLSRERPTVCPSSFWVIVTRGCGLWSVPCISASRSSAFASSADKSPKLRSSACSLVRRSRLLRTSSNFIETEGSSTQIQQKEFAVSEGCRVGGPRQGLPDRLFHIDIVGVRTEEAGLYLFVAIDRTSKFAFVELREKATTRIAAEFLAQGVTLLLLFRA